MFLPTHGPHGGESPLISYSVGIRNVIPLRNTKDNSKIKTKQKSPTSIEAHQTLKLNLGLYLELRARCHKSSPSLASGSKETTNMNSSCKFCMCVQSCLTLWDPMDRSTQGSSVHGILQAQEYWSGLPFPPPGDLPDSGIEPTSPVSPALQADSLPLSHVGSP